MFERFTETARKAMQFANDEANRNGHSSVDTHHVLVSLVGIECGVGPYLLGALGIDLEQMRAELAKVVPRGRDWGDRVRLLQSPLARSVIERALEEAQTLGDPRVGTAHILLGLARVTDGVAADFLRAKGLETSNLRVALSAVVAHGSPDDS